MTRTNFLLDGGIFLAFLIAMAPNFSGIAVHEWLSVALAATIVVHLLLHWRWITAVGARFFRKLWFTSRLKFVVDASLFVCFVSIMLSGILISRSFLPTIGVQISQVNPVWRGLHSLAASLGVLLVGLHFALNWGWVVSTFKLMIISPLVQLFRPRRPAPQQAPILTDDHSSEG